MPSPFPSLFDPSSNKAKEQAFHTNKYAASEPKAPTPGIIIQWCKNCTAHPKKIGVGAMLIVAGIISLGFSCGTSSWLSIALISAGVGFITCAILYTKPGCAHDPKSTEESATKKIKTLVKNGEIICDASGLVSFSNMISRQTKPGVLGNFPNSSTLS